MLGFCTSTLALVIEVGLWTMPELDFVCGFADLGLALGLCLCLSLHPLVLQTRTYCDFTFFVNGTWGIGLGACNPQ